MTSDDPSLLIVREPRRKSVSEQNIVHYPVELQVAASVWKGAPPFINVEVKCPTTGQAHMVPVRIQRGDQTGNLAVVNCCYIIIGAKVLVGLVPILMLCQLCSTSKLWLKKQL